MAQSTNNGEQMNKHVEFKTSISVNHYPIPCFHPDITYRKYAKITNIRRASHSWIHVGVGNPVGGWAMRITEAPTDWAKPNEIPEGIWVFADQLDEWRTELQIVRGTLNKLTAGSSDDSNHASEKHAIFMPSGNAPIFFGFMLFEQGWNICMSDSRGNQILLNTEEADELIEASNFARIKITQKLTGTIEIRSYFSNFSIAQTKPKSEIDWARKLIQSL